MTPNLIKSCGFDKILFHRHRYCARAKTRPNLNGPKAGEVLKRVGHIKLKTFCVVTPVVLKKW